MNNIPETPEVAAAPATPAPASAAAPKKRRAAAKVSADWTTDAAPTVPKTPKKATPKTASKAAKPAVKSAPKKAPAVAKKAVKPAKVEKAKADKAAKPAKAPKAEKLKLVRDSFTIPASEYAALEELKQRALKQAHPAKKSELLRAGIKLLASLGDDALLQALQAVPPIKTGRPKGGKSDAG